MKYLISFCFFVLSHRICCGIINKKITFNDSQKSTVIWWCSKNMLRKKPKNFSSTFGNNKVALNRQAHDQSKITNSIKTQKSIFAERKNIRSNFHCGNNVCWRPFLGVYMPINAKKKLSRYLEQYKQLTKTSKYIFLSWIIYQHFLLLLFALCCSVQFNGPWAVKNNSRKNIFLVKPQIRLSYRVKRYLCDV